ncbi:MAG: hypothetical protein ACI88C_000528 [Acidimicrobiales bacterium]|jgi:hypothetical protein
MDYLGYLIAGWGVVLGAVAIYAFSLLRRGKALTARVPADRRRWMTTDD